MRRSTLSALALTVGYILLAGAWILGSSSVAAHSSASVEELRRFETLKGVGYVLVTAVGLFFSARYALRRIERHGQELLRRERALLTNERRVFAGLLASTVAHDANNVLTLVMGELEDLEGSVAPATLARLRASLDKLVQLNRRLVNAARQTASSALAPLDLAGAVREALNLVRAHPAVRGTRLELSAGEAVSVVASPLLVAQIVTNLVVNAAEATAGRGTIDVIVRREPGGAAIEVDDDGPGIPPERRDGLFDALTTTKPEGNGMGLFSVKASVAALGGAVTVRDSPRGGACFRVTLPVSA